MSQIPTKDERSDQVVLADPFETRPYENAAMCSWCYKNMSVKVQVKAIRRELRNAKPNNAKLLDNCFQCQKQIPNCSVCLQSVTILNPMPEFINLQKEQHEDLNHNIDKWLLWCQTCQHGGHAGHMRDWFQTQDTCPISKCDCKCLVYR